GVSFGGAYVTGGAPMLGTGSMSTIPPAATVTGGAPMLGTGSTFTIPSAATVTGGAPMLGTGSTFTIPSAATTGAAPPAAPPLSAVNLGGVVVYPDYTWYYSQILAYSTLGALMGAYSTS